jgi:protein-disulfide isomerase
MKYFSALIIMLVLVAGNDAHAQTRRKARQAKQPATATPNDQLTETKAEPQPTPVPTSPAPADNTIPRDLAVLDGQTITVSDLNPAVAQEISKLGEKIAQARRAILDVQINTVLLELESKKRKISAQTLYDQEVVKRITEPTDAEIAKLIEANRAEVGQTDQATVRSEAVTFLKAEREQKLSEELVRKLKVTNPVVFVADLNSPDLKAETPLATVGGQSITAGNLYERLKPIIYKVRLSTYQFTRDALDRTMNDLVLLAEAKRRNIVPEDILRTEVTEKLREPSDAEIEKFYTDNKARINAELATVKPQIASYLREKAGNDLERALSDRLRKTANVRILLTEPEQPVQVVNTNGEPSRGDVNAPVTVVEFTDFECPACAAMNPVLEEVLPTYGNKVRFVVRNYPLSRHAHSRKAAEAANAANAQGKFFEYTALLFKRQKALDVPSLKKYATEVGLDRAKFDAELDQGVHAADVRRDLNDGEINGIDSTPTIFINGVKLNDLSPEGLRAAIDKALAKPRS